MAGLGLPPPPVAALPPPVEVTTGNPNAFDTSQLRPIESASFGGVLTSSSAAMVLEEEKKRVADAAQTLQNSPIVQGLTGHIRTFWVQARDAKTMVEREMVEALLARRGQYTPDKLAEIQKNKQTPIYMMVASAKMRQIESLIRDIMLGSGTDKPWTLTPTPVADLPPEIGDKIASILQTEIEMVLSAGVHVTMEDIRQRLRLHRDQMETRMREEAQIRCARMEAKMEDQLTEGNFLEVLEQFGSDLSTFKTAFIEGPIVRRRPVLSWGPDYELKVETKISLHWDRVSPFDIYPARYAKNLMDAPLIKRMKVTRESLNEMIGIEGYNTDAIKQVIAEYGTGGLRDWLSIDTSIAHAEGRTNDPTGDDTIDALMFYGTASGQMLLDWGMTAEKIPDVSKEYKIEAMLIGAHVVRAVLNDDPLGRRNIYGCSYQAIPGSVWGNAPYDLIKDCQAMCNAAARAMAGNLGIASGPQVAILSDRVPSNEDVTEMYPWKIWQFETDELNSTADPIKFFQPASNAAELMSVFEKFSMLADEYTGIPRYMAGFNQGAGGAGRTASGMSMMIGNASKIVKQVVGSIDTNIISPLLNRLYYYNMRFGEDPDLKGDVRVVARGALSLVVKEAAQLRINEYLGATANPIDMQIIGLEGRAELHRHAVRGLNINPDKVVPPVAVMKEKAALLQMSMLAQQNAQAQAQPQEEVMGPNNEQTLMDGAPVTDNFAPTSGN